MTHVDLQLITYLADNKWWRNLVNAFVEPQTPFEIHCFQQQTAEVTQALQFGQLQESVNADCGVAIKGLVSEEFLSYLLRTEKPYGRDIRNKMTSFFMLYLGDRFCSAYYGTEIYLYRLSPKELAAFERIILPVRSAFSILIYDHDIGGSDQQLQLSANA